MTIEFVIFGAVVFGIAAGLLLERMRSRMDMVPQPATGLQLAPPASFAPQALATPRVPAWFDGAAQLRLVSDARFASKRLLSDSETRVLEALETIIADMGQDWRVMAQVNLAEVVTSSDLAANSAIDDQRVDLLIVSPQQMPIAVVEYQALGQVREDDAIRDAVKREALRRAGIAYVEVRASDTPGSLRADIARLVGQQRAVPVAPAPGEPAPAPQPEIVAEITAAPVPDPRAEPVSSPARKPRQAAPRKPRGKPAEGVNP